MSTDEALVAGLRARLAHEAEVNAQLRAALTSRAVIDQALGVIMAGRGCDAAAAFDLLRAASQRRGIKLHALAQEVVDATAAGSPPGAGPTRVSPSSRSPRRSDAARGRR